MKLLARLRIWRDRRRFESDLAEEIRIHREMSGAAAFGSEALALEQSREVWGLGWLDSCAQDIRYALRGLRREPGFAIGVIGAISLGLGLNTTLFTVFNAYVLRPFAVRDPYGLYRFTPHDKTGNGRFLSIAEFESAREQRDVFPDVVAYDNLGADLAGHSAFVQLVSTNYFDMLGVGMTLGRPLLPGDREAMVLGYNAWLNKFGGDPSIVGRKLAMRGVVFEVVGVAGQRFEGLESVPISAWIPLEMRPAISSDNERLRIVVRIRPGLSVEGAKARLMPWARGLWRDTTGITLQRASTQVPLNPEVLAMLVPIFAAFGMVLLIACANVSNMMLARALARQRETAIRVSLGAGGGRLIRQFLTESLVLSIPAAAAGFVISEITINGARRLMFATLPPAFGRVMAVTDLAPDWRVFAYILAASIATAVLFGLAPALQSTRARVVEANRGDFSSDYRPARLRSALVVVQVAVCVFLLIGTAVVLRSHRRVSKWDVGLDTNGVWDVRMPPRFHAKAADRLANAPGVDSVAAAWRAPLYGSPRPMLVSAAGAQETVRAGFNFVSGSFFAVLRVPVLRGRAFTQIEEESEAAVVVVSDRAARSIWPGREAVGQVLILHTQGRKNSVFDHVPGFGSARVIGVVKDVISGMIANGEETGIYFPTSPRAGTAESLLVRIPGPRAEVRRRLERTINEIAPSAADFLIPLDDAKDLQIYPFRVTFWVGGFLGAVALLLTVSGIYGVMSYVVNQRTKEIGIRVALGAGSAEIVRMVLRQSGKLAAWGTGIGVALAVAIAPLGANQIQAVNPYEWQPYALSILVGLGSAIAASLAPSRRAVRIDPIVTLRCD